MVLKNEEEETEEQSKEEEVFVDKERAAAVLTGECDLQESLDRRRWGAGRGLQGPRARFLMSRGHWEAALRCLRQEEGTPLSDSDRMDWLVSQAMCQANLGQPLIALDHLREVLELDPCHFPAVCLKGELLFSMCDLEQSHLCFVQAHRLKPKDQICMQGVRKTRLALEEKLSVSKLPNLRNSKRAEDKLSTLTHSKFSNSINSTSKDVEEHSTSIVSENGPSMSQEMVEDTIRSNQSERKGRKAKKASGTRRKSRSMSKELDSDKQFLENILKNKELRCSKTPYLKQALELFGDMYGFVNDRQQFWHQEELHSAIRK